MDCEKRHQDVNPMIGIKLMLADQLLLIAALREELQYKNQDLMDLASKHEKEVSDLNKQVDELQATIQQLKSRDKAKKN
jgi:uncharacterized protein YlxW (UPF0749 family)